MQASGRKQGDRQSVQQGDPRSVLDTANEAFVSMDAGGFITDWNLHDISERKRGERYFRGQHAVTRVIAEAETIEEAIPGLLEALGESMGWQVGAYWSLGAQLDALVCRHVWHQPSFDAGEFEDLSMRLPLAPGTGLPGRVWEGGEPAWIQDVTVDDNFPRAKAAAGVGLHAAIALPAMRASAPLAVLEFFSTQIQPPDRELIEVMSGIGLQIGQFIAATEERAALLRRFERLAHTDELTELPNRRGWEEELRREIARATRRGSAFSATLLDLDMFKEFNDEHGHPAGDVLLKDAAAGWRAVMRASDFLARHGGDEFALLLPDATLDQAMIAVERVRGATPAPVTASAGVAEWNGSESPDALMARVDAARYEAKRAGRNRAVAAGPG